LRPVCRRPEMHIRRVRGSKVQDTDFSRKMATAIETGHRNGIKKWGRGGGLGWDPTVVGHMPWGALSGSPRVRGHERVFWGCCGGFRAPVVQCMQYMQILITYIHIHANTYKYLHIHTYRRQQNTGGSNIPIKYRQISIDTCRYMHIPTSLKTPTPP
jgi:hypothetical protein